MTAADTKNTTVHGTAIPGVRGGADGTKSPEKEPVMGTVAQPSDNSQIEPFVFDPPVKYKTEKQLANHLTKVYGEAPVGMDLFDIYAVAGEPYLTKAEQDAAIHEAVGAQQPDPPAEYAPDAMGAWKRRAADQNTIRIPKEFRSGESSLESISPFPRPTWSNPDHDLLGRTISFSQFRSDSLVATAISNEMGVKLPNGTWDPSYLQVHIFRELSGFQPLVRLDRYGAVHSEKPKDGTVRISDWEVALTSTEAVQLAHTLLAAVDVITDAEVSK